MKIHRISHKSVCNKSCLKKAIAFVITIAITVTLVSCKDQTVKKENGENLATGVENKMNSVTDEKNLNSAEKEKKAEIIGNYQYPENPAEELRNALASDVNKRGIPAEISSLNSVEFNGNEYTQINITFSGGNENMCVISFTNKYFDYEETLDGKDNPSFVMAFKDPDNSQDMIAILTSVIKYLSPDLNLEEAERLATKQDETISTDGYSMPQDIGGYQVQTIYTNPHVFFRVQDFEAKLVVKVTALKQMWGTLDTQRCQELKTSGDYSVLTREYAYWEENEQVDMVYSDFIVKNVWQNQSYLHGETWEIVDVESMTGQQYSFNVDTMRPYVYEFGIGQRYTLYIWLRYYGRIMYAVQQSESAQLNSRGAVQPIDYPAGNWSRRIDPVGEGTVYDVYFGFQSQSAGEIYAASEGSGIGETQWIDDPVRENYTFVGWYDNPYWNGSPYSKDTPIYQDTYLYAKWKYSGSGGVYPRARRGNIQGIDEGSSLLLGQKLTVTATGYNMNLESPKDQRFRWTPVNWRLSDGSNGSFSSEAPFQATLSLDSKGDHRLYITYMEEIFDGIDWQKTSQSHEVEEIMLQIGS